MIFIVSSISRVLTDEKVTSGFTLEWLSKWSFLENWVEKCSHLWLGKLFNYPTNQSSRCVSQGIHKQRSVCYPAMHPISSDLLSWLYIAAWQFCCSTAVIHSIYDVAYSTRAVIKFLVTCSIELDTCNNLVAFLVKWPCNHQDHLYHQVSFNVIQP